MILLTDCFYCEDEELLEVSSFYDDDVDMSYVIGWCPSCHKWYDIQFCHNCENEVIDEILDEEDIRKLLEIYGDEIYE